MVHKVKCWPEYFQAIGEGVKTFDVRILDRPYAVGDLLHLDEYEPSSRHYSGRWIVCKIVYLMVGGGFGIASNYCVLGIRLPANHQWPILKVGSDQ